MVPTNARVSVVMIFLDAATYIDDAIRSVVDQRDVRDWELLLVDDGSTDASTDIARQWAAKDERIRYLEHEGHANRGMSASRNLGVAEARAEWVAFLDSDDIWLPMLLRERLDVIARFPDVDGVMGGTWQWWTWEYEDPDDGAADHRRPDPPVPFLTPLEPPELFVASYRRPFHWRSPGMCSILLRRSALQGIGGADESFRTMYEDQVLYCKLALHLRLVVDPRPYALYRQHPDSTCAKAEVAGEYHPYRPSIDAERFVQWLRRYVAECGLDQHPEVRHVVRRNLRVYGPLGRRWWMARHRVVVSLPEPVKRPLRRVRDKVEARR